MTPFVSECRKEWKRLGVPDLLAEEMAAELAADLAEAEADGVSAAEFLGESDPRRFADTWATERGLVREPPPQKSRKHLWIALAACFAFVCITLTTLALIQVGNEPAHAANSVKVPQFVGLEACRAVHIGHVAHLTMVHTVYRGRCDALVVSQKPAAGSYVPARTRTRLGLSLVRVPQLVGLTVCRAKLAAARAGVWIRRRQAGYTGTRPLPRSSRCTNVVVGQEPAAGRIVNAPVYVTVTIREVR